MSSTTTTPRVQAVGLLNGGLLITSTSTPALNAVYSVEGLALDALRAECDSLQANSGNFTNGTTSVQWPDTSGAPHTFTAAQFRTLANAINSFVVACYQYATGASTTAPASTATIP